MAFLVLVPFPTSFGQATRESDAVPPAGTNSAAPADRSLLEELNRETQGLYRDLQGGVLHVQVPETVVARNTSARNNWIVTKYSGLNNEMKQRLTEPANSPDGPADGSGSGSNSTNAATNGAASRLQNIDPSNPANPANSAGVPENASNLTIIVPAAAQDQQGQGVYAAPARALPQATGFSPNNIGLLLDDHGHVLVPQYVDRESIGERLIHLTSAGGVALDAKLVGSDQQTGLSVLQLVRNAARAGPALLPGPTPATGPATVVAAEPTQSVGQVPFHGAKPVKLGKTKPVDGSLVLLLSPGGGMGRLGVWNGGGRDYGVIVNIDGQVAGITRYGQFLSGAACQLIADQIIRNGSVRRATLGIFISQIEKDDPLRRTQPLLGDGPAVRVDDVVARSVAQRGGLKPGDVLLALDGEPATDIPTLAAAIAAKNGPVCLRVLRGNQVIELTVDLQRK